MTANRSRVVATLIATIVFFAGGGSYGAEPAGSWRAPLEALGRASQGAEIWLPVSEGPAARILRGGGVDAGDTGRLRVRRRACMAVLSIDLPRYDECRQDRLFRDYDLEIDPTALEPASVAVRKGKPQNRELGFWVEAACRAGEFCARLLVPAHAVSIRVETEILMKSFGDTPTTPRIRVPCVDSSACDAAAAGLRTIAEQARAARPPVVATAETPATPPQVPAATPSTPAVPSAKPPAPAPAASTGDLVGAWSFVAPYPTGWVLEYRADGTFAFNTPNLHIIGTYTARDGRWSHETGQPQFDDGGTYRLLDANTVELAGKLGVGRWTRQPGTALQTAPAPVSAPAAVSGAPVGLWERSYQDAAGQKYFDVLELAADGTYVKHARRGTTDRGRYAVSGRALSFQSLVDERNSRDVAFTVMGGTTLVTEFVPPAFARNAAFFRQVEEWRLSNRAPNFRTLAIDGRSVPRSIAALMATALTARAQPWRPDALPTWVRVEELRNGHYSMAFTFYAPSSVEQMTVTYTAYGMTVATADGARTLTEPLPPDFVDLPLAVAAAKKDGLAGVLKKADIRVYKNHGPAWSLLSTAGKRATVNGVTGEPVHGDITGYVARYNADWDRIHAQWRSMLSRLAPRPSPSSSSSWSSSSSGGSDGDSGSSSSGPDYGTGLQNSWGSGDTDAYNRFQSGTPNADDCSRYGC